MFRISSSIHGACFLFLAALAFLVQPQTIDLAGKIVDNTGKPVSGATVSLVKVANLQTKTLADGTFKLQQNTAINTIGNSTDSRSGISVKNNILIVHQASTGSVAISIYNMKGIVIHRVFSGRLEKGGHVFSVPENLSQGVRVIGISRDASTRYYKTNSNGLPVAEVDMQANSMVQMTAYGRLEATDTLKIAMIGFETRKLPVEAYVNKNISTQLSPLVVKYPRISGGCRPCGMINSCLKSCPNGAIVRQGGKAFFDKTKCKGVDSGCNANCTKVTCFLKISDALKDLKAAFIH